MDADTREPTTLETAWPLFGLRLRSEHLVLRLPLEADFPAFIDLAKDGIHPPDEMPFGVAWSVLPSPAFERGFVQHHWGVRATWTPEDWTLNLLVELDGQAIGTQTLLAKGFAIHRTVDTGSWLGEAFQGQGYGKEMRSAVLSLAFDGLGARAAESAAFTDNLKSSGVSRSLGYAENGIGSLAPQGVARDSQRFRMTVDDWRSRPRPPVEIEGLEACRELFGA
ncbi:MAG TPA: GNAT family N-acetyltransferase [Methylomirabilota bacterium]|nr:GNAT family N-acetyltransferase [Methylomirabilota bacterium]